jgi:hypothetical protein
LKNGGSFKVRTGSVGNRSAEDMVRTLVEPKKTVISGLREKLLNAGFLEEVEYDTINIEPVLIYSKGERKIVFVKHKWDLVAMVPMKSSTFPDGFSGKVPEEFSKYQFEDEDANKWLKFSLPLNEEQLFAALDLL